VGETADVRDLLGLNPLALFGDGSGTVIGALGHGAHMLYFCTINHGKFPFFQKAVLPPSDLHMRKTRNPGFSKYHYNQTTP
jgi:hypothetical protein